LWTKPRCLGNCRYSYKLAVRVCRAKALPIADYIGLKVNLNPSRRITGDWYPFVYPVGIEESTASIELTVWSGIRN
jgi:hypothetical protein